MIFVLIFVKFLFTACFGSVPVRSIRSFEALADLPFSIYSSRDSDAMKHEPGLKKTNRHSSSLLTK